MIIMITIVMNGDRVYGYRHAVSSSSPLISSLLPVDWRVSVDVGSVLGLKLVDSLSSSLSSAWVDKLLVLEGLAGSGVWRAVLDSLVDALDGWKKERKKANITL